MMQLPVQKYLFRLILTILLMFTAPLCFAESDGSFSAAEEKIELEDFSRFAELLPFEGKNPDTLKHLLLNEGFTVVTDKEDKFGVRTVEFEKNSKRLYGRVTRLIIDSAQQTIEAYGVYLWDSFPKLFSKKISEIWQAHGGQKLTRYSSLSVMSQSKLHDEVDDIYQLLQLVPFEQQDPVILKQQLIQFGYKVYTDETDRFGFTRMMLYKESHYKVTNFHLGIFNNTLAYYNLRVFFPKDNNSHYAGNSNHPLSKRMVEVWQQNSDVALGDWNGEAVYDGELVAVQSFQDVYDDYFQTVSRGQGELGAVSAPKDLLSSYAALVSDKSRYAPTKGYYNFGDSVESNDVAISQSIDKLLAAGRVDLLENALDGFNSRARLNITGQLGLLGLDSKPINKKKIDKIINNMVCEYLSEHNIPCT